MKTFYFVRHGLSTGNKSDAFYVDHNIELAEEGIEQAKIIGRRLSFYPADMIITSKLKRAIQTAQIIVENINSDIPINIIEEVHEIEAAKTLYGHKRDSEHAKNTTLLEEANAHDENFKLEGKESIKEIKARVREFLDYLSNVENDNIIIITHGHFLRYIIACNIIGYDAPSNLYRDISFAIAVADNTSITTITYDDNAKYKWKLKSYNDNTHL